MRLSRVSVYSLFLLVCHIVSHYEIVAADDSITVFLVNDVKIDEKQLATDTVDALTEWCTYRKSINFVRVGRIFLFSNFKEINKIFQTSDTSFPIVGGNDIYIPWMIQGQNRDYIVADITFSNKFTDFYLLYKIEFPDLQKPFVIIPQYIFNRDTRIIASNTVPYANGYVHTLGRSDDMIKVIKTKKPNIVVIILRGSELEGFIEYLQDGGLFDTDCIFLLHDYDDSHIFKNVDFGEPPVRGNVFYFRTGDFTNPATVSPYQDTYAKVTANKLCGEQGTFTTKTGQFENFKRLSRVYTAYNGVGTRKKFNTMIEYTDEGKMGMDYLKLPTSDELIKKLVVKVAAEIYEPFVFYDNSGNLTGFSVDVINVLAEKIGVEIIFDIIPESDVNSTKLFLESEFTLALQKVYDRQADMAIGNLVVREDLKSYFNFIDGFKFFTTVIASKKKDLTIDDVGYFSFIQTFDWQIWVILLFSILAVSIFLAFLNIIYPEGDEYRLYDVLFLVTCKLFHGCYFKRSKTNAVRLLLSFWEMFVLFFIIIFIANHSAMRSKTYITNQEPSDIQRLNAMIKPKYSLMKNSVTGKMLMESSNLYMNNVYLASHFYMQNSTWSSINTAIDKIVNEDYILLHDDFTLRYFAERRCFNLDSALNAGQFGFAVGKNFRLYQKFQDVMKELVVQEVIDDISDKYVNRTYSLSSECKRKHSQTSISHTLSFGFDDDDFTVPSVEIIGIMIVLLVLCVLSLVVAICEVVFVALIQKIEKKRQKYKAERRINRFF